jgi:CO/xanthine dehydrogenase Mo-binding subunit
MDTTFRHVNKSQAKLDALALATGRERFTGDFSFPDLLHVVFLQSPHAFARIRDIDEREARAVAGVVDILSYRNVPRVMYTTAGQGYPEPSPYDTCLFDTMVRYVGDRVAAVVAESEEAARLAAERLRVDFEVLEPLFDPERADREGAPVIHPEEDCRAAILVPYHPQRNTPAVSAFSVGEVDRALATAERIVEGTFTTQYAAHCALEPHVAVSYLDERGRLVVVSSTQVPFHARRITSRVTGIPVSQIRVVKPRIGGGFGAKQEVILEPYVALVTYRTHRPARALLSRREVFTLTRTRHPFRITIRAGYSADGAIQALDFRALENTGAYGAHALTVLSNAGAKVLPLLNKIPHLRFEGKAVYTNLPVAGAYRGYGATQGVFAYGQIVDAVAADAGVDPVDYYRRWAIRSGETSPVFEALGEGKEGVAMRLHSVGLGRCLEAGAREFGWSEKRARYAASRAGGPATSAVSRPAAGTKTHGCGGTSTSVSPGARRRRGVGMVALMQGSAIPLVDMASAWMKMNDDGSFHLAAGATDIGTGSDTILAQIAAEVLDVPPERITVYSSDTDFTPFDTGAYASSTTYLSGEAVRKCALAVREQILKVAADILGVPAERLACRDGRVAAAGGAGGAGEGSVDYGDLCRHALYMKDQFQIQACASHVAQESPPPFAAHFAEVEVDAETGFLTVLDYVAAVDCGTPLNPILAEGQCEGAIVNGLSYALTERYIFSGGGRTLNDSFGRYNLYTAPDVGPVRVFLVDGGYEPSGPFGAKSVAEININGALPAIANAFCHATGKRLYHAPFTPERVLQALESG